MVFQIPIDIEEFILYAIYSDDAIDVEKSNVEKYIAELDPKHLVFIDGKNPVRFVFRSPTRRDIAGARAGFIGEKTEDLNLGEVAYLNSTLGLRRCIVRIEGEYPVSAENPRWVDALDPDDVRILWQMVQEIGNSPLAERSKSDEK